MRNYFVLIFISLLLIVTPAHSQLPVDSAAYYTNKVNSLVLKMNESGNKLNIGLDYGKLAIEFAKKSKDKSLIGIAYRKIGNFYAERFNNFGKALESYYTALKAFESAHDDMGIAGCYNNIGNTYNQKAGFSNDPSEYAEAIRFHRMAIDIRMKSGQQNFIAQSYLNIGNIETSIGRLTEARTHYESALKIYKSIRDYNGQDLCLLNLAELSGREAKKSGRKILYEKSLRAFEEYRNHYDHGKTVDSGRYVEYLLGVAEINMYLGDLSKAISKGKDALRRAEQMRQMDLMQSAYLFMHEYFTRTGNYELSLNNYKKYISLRDSLNHSLNNKSFSGLQALYENDQKENEIEILRRDKSIRELELVKKQHEVNSQRTLSFISLLIIALIVLLALLIYKRYQLKKKANLALAKAYHLIEGTNKQITDSINYAKRIQDAILPDEEEVKKYFSDAFFFFRPKAIVSGDFFWFTRKNEWSIIAAADCTGHGVPGAFMSMISNTLLNEIVNEKQIVEPAEILAQLNKGVAKLLNQSNGGGNKQDDGMDISICAFNDTNKELRFAGANQSLYMVNQGVSALLEGDLFSIGGMFARREFNYTEKKQKVEKGTMIYLFTDGFQDQFGGTENKKFLSSRFEKLLLDIHAMKLTEQKQKLETEFDTWRNGKDQVDDVLVLGFRV